MLCLAALERNAVYEALEVDINGIILLSLALYGLGAGRCAEPCGSALP